MVGAYTCWSGYSEALGGSKCVLRLLCRTVWGGPKWGHQGRGLSGRGQLGWKPVQIAGRDQVGREVFWKSSRAWRHWWFTKATRSVWKTLRQEASKFFLGAQGIRSTEPVCRDAPGPNGWSVESSGLLSWLPNWWSCGCVSSRSKLRVLVFDAQLASSFQPRR